MMDISVLMLTDRQIKAGLKVVEDEHWLFLINGGQRRIATFGVGTDREHIQAEADRYLLNVDYQI